MSNSISYVQAVVALGAAENASGKTEVNSVKVKNGERQRKQLEEKIRAKQAEIEEKRKELEEVADRGIFECIGDWLCGNADGGAGELEDEINTKAAEMKKASRELQAEMAKIEGALREMQNATSEHGARTNEVKKTFDENDKAAQAAAA